VTPSAAAPPSHEGGAPEPTRGSRNSLDAREARDARDAWSVLAASNAGVRLPDSAHSDRVEACVVIRYPDWFLTPTSAQVLDARLHLASEAGATLALTHGVVGTSSPILRRAGFTRYGEQRQLARDVLSP
jgi:hypothetical protein